MSTWTVERIDSQINKLVSQGFGFYGERDALNAFCGWLTKNSQEHWLWAVQAYNWGNGELPLQFMLESDDCDFAVAKSIFWMSEFDYYFQNDEQWLKNHNSSAAKVLKFIIDREHELGFPRSHLTRLEWAGPEKDTLIAANCRKVDRISAPQIPESLLDLSDLPRCRPRASFAHLKIENTWAFRELGTEFWNSSASTPVAPKHDEGFLPKFMAILTLMVLFIPALVLILVSKLQLKSKKNAPNK